MSLNRHRFPALSWLLLLVTICVGLVIQIQAKNYYPSIRIQATNDLSLQYLNKTREDQAACQTVLDHVERQMLAQCPNCKIIDKTCSNTLPPSQIAFFTDQAQSSPVLYLNEGLLVFESNQSQFAQQSCQETAKQLNDKKLMANATCHAAEQPRPFFRPKDSPIDLTHLGFALLALLVAQLFSKFACYLIIRYEHLHAHLSHDHTEAGPQKFHALPTPRIGGLPIVGGIFISAALLPALPNHFSDQLYQLLLLAAMPAFLGGITEDITKKVGVSQRLLLTILSGVLGCLLLGATLDHLGIPGVDALFTWAPLAIAFTAFAVGGIANSVNIIDGYNGLASGFAIIASLAMAVVAGQHGDSLLLYANLAMAGALLGFIGWNWPMGKIFLGDGGAYFTGFWLAEMTILLVVRNPSVSVWFPLAIMIHPVFETLFTIYRRKFLHESHPGMPDANHLHQMIYKRLVRLHVGSREAQHKTRRNSRVAPYFWAFTGMTACAASMIPGHEHALQLLCLLYCAAYIWLYRRLSSWRIPKWLIKTEKLNREWN